MERLSRRNLCALPLPKLLPILEAEHDDGPRYASVPKCRKCSTELYAANRSARGTLVCIDCEYLLGVDTHQVAAAVDRIRRRPIRLASRRGAR
jgi:ribosomal protein L37AE/L43A